MSQKDDRRAIEAQAIYVAGVTMVASSAIGLFLFWGKLSPIFGHMSIGSFASIIAAAAGFGAFLRGYYSPLAGRAAARIRQALRLAAMSFVHAAICLLLVAVVFYLGQSAFTGVQLDQWVAAALIGVSAGVCGYAAFLAGAQINTLRLSIALAVFLVAGVMTSMITAENPYWWQLHFSSLGAGHTASAAAFNLTLIVAGLVVVCVADFVAADIQRIQRAKVAGYSHIRVRAVRLSIAAIGLLLAGVGIFEYDVYGPLHALCAGGMAIVFLGLVIGMPWIAPGLPRAFIWFSYAMVAAILACNWLAAGVGYLNLTAFELLCGAIIFAWIIVFVRNLAAEQTAIHPAAPY